MYKFKEADINDIDTLISICKTWNVQYNETLKEDMHEYFTKCITKGDLPPICYANKRDYRLYLVAYEENIIGYFDLYFGYPKKETTWISILIIDRLHRSKGHASRILKVIEKDYLRKDIRNIAIGVHLNNFNGLKFWTRNGFKNVLGVFGSEDNGVIGLEKSL